MCHYIQQAFQAERTKVDTRLAEANKTLERSKFELQNQEPAVADARQAGRTQQAEQLDKEIAELRKTVGELEGYTRSLASMSSRMAV